MLTANCQEALMRHYKQINQQMNLFVALKYLMQQFPVSQRPQSSCNCRILCNFMSFLPKMHLGSEQHLTTPSVLYCLISTPETKGKVYLLQMRETAQHRPFSPPASIARALRELRVSEVSALRLTLEVILQPCDVMRKQPEAPPPSRPSTDGGAWNCRVNSLYAQSLLATLVKQSQHKM